MQVVTTQILPICNIMDTCINEQTKKLQRLTTKINKLQEENDKLPKF
jgi:hypothetical protein